MFQGTNKKVSNRNNFFGDWPGRVQVWLGPHLATVN